MKRMLFIAAGSLLLAACASTGTRDGMVYRDGSWYSPAGEGHGDYYTGVSHDHDYYYDWPWAWSVGYVPFGGYCPVQYRYCTSFWADAWYWPGYYPWGYQPWVYYPHRPTHRRHRSETPIADADDSRPPPRNAPEERPPSRRRDGGPGVSARRSEGGTVRPRRRQASDSGGGG
jgi:hypothetical protein